MPRLFLRLMHHLLNHELYRAVVIVTVLAVSIGSLLYAGILAPPAQLPVASPRLIKPQTAPVKRVPAVMLQDFRAEDEHFDIPMQESPLTLVNSFASWCAQCRAEWPQLRKLDDLHGLSMIGINAAADRGLDDFLNVMGDPFDRIGIDTQGNVLPMLGMTQRPETLLIDHRGTVLFQHAGPLDAQAVEAIMELVHKPGRLPRESSEKSGMSPF